MSFAADQGVIALCAIRGWFALRRRRSLKPSWCSGIKIRRQRARRFLYSGLAGRYTRPLGWGYSSAGRALAWHARGQRFDPAYLHQSVSSDRKQMWLPVCLSPSSRGLGHRPFTAITGVRIPVGTPLNQRLSNRLGVGISINIDVWCADAARKRRGSPPHSGPRAADGMAARRQVGIPLGDAVVRMLGSSPA